MTQNKKDTKNTAVADATNKTGKINTGKTPTDTRAAVKPQFILDNRDLLHLAVARPNLIYTSIFVLMAPKNDLLKTFVEQRTFKKRDDAVDYSDAVQGMVAANYAMYPDVMDLLEDAIKKFNDAMQKMREDTNFWNNPHTK